MKLGLFETKFSSEALLSNGFKESYFKSLLLWNPAAIFVFTLVFGGLKDFGHHLLTSFLIGTLVMHFCFASTLVARWIVRTFSKRGTENPLLRSKGWSLSVSCMSMPLGLYLTFKIFQALGIGGGPANLDDYRLGMFLGTMIAGIYFLFETRAEARKDAKDAQMKLLQAQLSALTAQMNPHLLFNALNTVASLVPTDPVKAEEMIVKLSELYRGVLDSSRSMTHSLATEIGICEAYLAIERARFGDRLHAEIKIAPEVDVNRVQVPALCLQPLIENAIKHGIAPRAEGGSVLLSARVGSGVLHIQVEDDGVGLTASQGQASRGAGTGIQNCRDRLSLHFGPKGVLNLEDGAPRGTRVRIEMPVTSA